ncbi:MAG: protein kinase, partial [Phycisphaerae bacterium]|nr:protein kinase [Phycisphaerae bacterium]
MTVPASFGDFLLVSVLGRGSTGVVCKALDENLHRQVAIKILNDDEGNEEVVEACSREARALASLNHPHVVQVHTIGEYRTQPYIVMELLDGGSVEQQMLDRPVEESAALEIAIDITEGLQAAHRVGLVHMDVKPGNILFDREFNAKLIDFGVAQATRHSSGEVQGTPYYVAPEVVRGHDVDIQADIYSLGATLFHLLANRVPFPGNDAAEVMTRRTRQAAPSLSEIRRDLHPRTVEVVARMLEQDPRDRYASYDQLLTHLKAARESLDRTGPAGSLAELQETTTSRSGPRRTPPPTRAPRREAPARANRAWAIGAVALILVAAGVGIYLAAGGNTPSPPAPPRHTVSPGTHPTPPAPAVVRIRNAATPFAQDPRWKTIAAVDPEAESGARLVSQADASILVSGPPAKAAERYVVQLPLNDMRTAGLALEAMGHESLPKGGPGRGTSGNFILTGISVEISAPDDPNKWQPVELEKPRASYAQSGFPVSGSVDGNDETGWAVSPRYAQNHTAVFPFRSTIDASGSSRLRVTLTHASKYPAHLGHFRLWVQEAEPEPAPPARTIAARPSDRAPAKPQGQILQELWLARNIASLEPDALRDVLKTAPNREAALAAFQAPPDLGDRYLQRLSGFVYPPEDGEYIFYLSSNDESVLSIESGDAEAESVRVTHLQSPVASGRWAEKNSSPPVRLKKGKGYFIEVVHRETTGKDHLAVGWKLPSGKLERPIPGARLSPARTPTPTPPPVATKPVDRVAQFPPTYDPTQPMVDEQQWYVLDVVKATARFGSEIEKLEDGGLLAKGPRPAREILLLEAVTTLSGITAFRFDFPTDPSLPDRGPGRSDQGQFILTGLRIMATGDGESPGNRQIQLAPTAVASQEDKNFKATGALDADNPKTGWSPS